MKGCVRCESRRSKQCRWPGSRGDSVAVAGGGLYTRTPLLREHARATRGEASLCAATEKGSGMISTELALTRPSQQLWGLDIPDRTSPSSTARYASAISSQPLLLAFSRLEMPDPSLAAHREKLENCQHRDLLTGRFPHVVYFAVAVMRSSALVPPRTAPLLRQPER